MHLFATTSSAQVVKLGKKAGIIEEAPSSPGRRRPTHP
jgi:hypothetical protein